jgi:hypothetical protein
MDMNIHDEELQDKVLSGMADDSRDGVAYKKIFHALTSEPDFNLPVHFADKVIREIEAKEEKSVAREMYWLAAGIFTLSVGAVIGALLSGFKPSFGAYKFLASYPGLIGFGLALIVLIQWLDKKLVRPKTTL